jgi:signal transduction histidine kinase
MRTLVAERDAELVQSLANNIAILLDRYTRGLNVLAGLEELRHDDPHTVQAVLTDATQALPGIALWVADAYGRLLAGSQPAPDWMGEVIPRLLTASVSADQPMIALTADRHTIFWGVPLREGGGWLLAGVPVQALDLSRLLEIGQRDAVAALMVVDGEGHVLYGRDEQPRNGIAIDWPGVAQALRGESGTLFVLSPQGEQVVAYAPVPNVGWALVIREPWEALAAPLLHFDRVVPFILLATAMISLLTLFFGLHSVVRPLQRLGVQADQIGQGHFEAASVPIGGVKEIEELRRVLDRMARQIQHYQTALQDYVGALTRAQEEERSRLARELHDETIQTLIALGQRIQMVQRTLERDPARTGERLGELRSMVEDAIEEVRRFSRALRPLYLEELGLVPALEMLASEAGATFHVTGDNRHLPAEKELALYRVAQEALNNALYHAQAHSIAIELTFTKEDVTLRVRDDGRGFVVPEHFTDLARAGHFGLMGMHERIHLVGGRLTVTSTPGRGTVVEAWLVCPQA